MWVLLGVAVASEVNFEEAAEARMQLDFDLEQVEGKLKKSAARAPSPAAAAPAPAYDAYGTPIQAPPPPPDRLPLEANSTVRSVSVHTDRAFVTRFREVQLPAGASTVTFEGLPFTLLSEGLAASIESGPVRIVSVELVSGAGEVRDDERIEAVRQEAEGLIGQLGLVRDRIASLLAEREYLRSALVPDGATEIQSVASVRTGLDFVSESERRLAKELREQEKEAEELAEKVSPLLVKLEDPLATGQPVRIEVEAEQAGPARISLEYVVTGAGWSPSYSARLDPGTGRVELEVYGVVRQATGEDWENAEIALSTAAPGGRSTVLDLAPWTLGRSGGVGVYGALDMGTGATTGAPPGPGAGGGVVDARLSAQVQGRGAVVLAIPGKRTIRGDGSPQRLPVGVQQLDATISLSTIPKLAPEVRRSATLRYNGELPLLPGPTSSFVGKDYVGSGNIDAVLPGEALTLGFGADDRYRVTRQLVTRQQERVGRKSTRYTFRFRTTVANHGDKGATVLLIDQLPLAEDTRVEVKVLDTSGATSNAEDGTLQWSLTVPPHAEASTELAFSVTVPDELSYLATEFEALY
jgi:hypothetical protein